MPLLQTFLLALIPSVTYTVLLALPAWALWTVAGLGTHYFAFLPMPWQSVPLAHVAGLFLLVWILKSAWLGLGLHLQFSRQA